MEACRKRDLLEYVEARLVDERRHRGAPIAGLVRQLADAAGAPGASDDELWLACRALMNVREPWPADCDFLAAQDELLTGLIRKAGVTSVDTTEASPLDARLRLWRGDITTLSADAIVNAANDGMTGCWAPLHYCIDNAIHTFAGVQLRLECARIMQRQGHPEPTGQAKVTAAYNLPSKHVIHTVGPIANGRVDDTLRAQLGSCYTSCLNAAAGVGCASIAFCCISTGVFGFPADEAAEIAVRTVRKWLAKRDAAGESTPTVVFNVFQPEDETRYRRLLKL